MVSDKGPVELTPAFFADVAADHANRGAIEALFVNGVTGGCQALPQRARQDPGFVPPPAPGIFADVPVAHPFAAWIEELFVRGVTTGCQPFPAAFCPAGGATRAQTAVFLVRAFGFGF